MKHFRLLYLALPILALTACQSDDERELIPDSQKGKEVNFTIGDPKSRTVYGDDWDDTTNGHQVLWGFYIDNSELAGTIDPQYIDLTERIKIFCKQSQPRGVAVYQVNYENQKNEGGITSGVTISRDLTQSPDHGVQWGDPATPHSFYAFYPSYRCGDTFIDDAGQTIKATITPGQSPVKYALKLAGSSDPITRDALMTGANNTNPSESNLQVFYGLPDMTAAVMAAKRTVEPTDYGKAVGLQFNILADVLDITVNGPLISNTLAGGNRPGTYIAVHSVRIIHKSGAPITGDFDINLESGAVTNVTGNPYIQLNTAYTDQDYNYTLYPVLYARSSATTPTANNVDRLRLRAFMIPGQVKNLDELSIEVSTNCGVYTKDLANSTVATGKIHRVRMPSINSRGAEFKFENWVDQLNPNIYVNELSIPGSWHSFTYAPVFPESDRMQSSDIETQFNAGVRAFEAWVTDLNNTAYIYPTSLGITLQSQLQQLGQWVAGKDEFVIFEIGRYGGTQQGFASGVQAALNANSAYIFQGPITPNTTLGQVKGKVIVKVNTNDATDANYWTGTDYKALFSRYIESTDKPSEAALKWGGPIAPDAASDMKIYSVETSVLKSHQDLVNTQAALKTYGESTYNFWKSGNHNYWYTCLAGGTMTYEDTFSILGGEGQVTGPDGAALIQGTYMLEQLSNPLRSASPYGIVYMNFVSDDSLSTHRYRTPDLIRQVINNNMAFTLNRAE